MESFPTPLEPVFVPGSYEEPISMAEDILSEVIGNAYANTEAGLMASMQILDEVAQGGKANVGRNVGKAARMLTTVAKKVPAPQPAIETRMIDVEWPTQPAGNPPLPCRCAIPIDFDFSNCIGPCGTVARCDPVTGIIIECRPDNCQGVPDGWCRISGGPSQPPVIPPGPPPPPPPPYPQPPPEQECCPEQVIQISCGGDDNSNKSQVCPPDKQADGACCDSAKDCDVKPLDSGGNSQSGTDIPICADTKKCQDFTLVAIQPFPYARDGKSENVRSECGWAQLLSDYGDADPIGDYLGHGDIAGLTAYGLTLSKTGSEPEYARLGTGFNLNR